MWEQRNQINVDSEGGFTSRSEEGETQMLLWGVGPKSLPQTESDPPLGRPAWRHRPTTSFLVRLYNGLSAGVQIPNHSRERGTVSHREITTQPDKKHDGMSTL
jgi:hypothetical protein